MTAGARRRLGAGFVAVLAAFGFHARTAIAQEVVDLPAEDRMLSPDLELVYSVGSAAAEAAWAEFSSIPSLWFDGSGNLHLMDQTAALSGRTRIVVVDPAGGLVTEFGRAGDGPGEFRAPRQMVVWADGSTLVQDIMHMGYHVFAPGGEFEHMLGMELGSDMRPERTGVRSAVGGARDRPTGEEARAIRRFDLSSGEVSEQPLVEAWAPRALEERDHEADDPEAMGSRPEWGFEPGLLFDVLPSGGVAFSDSSAYAIKLTDPSGAVSRILRRPIRPLPVTESMRREERERRLERVRNPIMTGSRSPEAMAAMDFLMGGRRQAVENMRFHPEVPVLAAVRTTWDGALWIQRSAEPGVEEPGPVDVLAPDGRYVGTLAPDALRMPRAFGPGGLVAFVEPDEFDVPVITVRRLPPEIR
ncbi:MAG: hypothetical protein F4Z33_02325 [Gemmatimonadales bacterium]|nr:hypothetical protein [Gemmatimonadales bacterium]MXX77830.1 hypothetical protein [Gemmatimonadales bacterium]MYC89096.1 hypothetical protein [Candidatus Palauibacter denitrificans]